MSHGGEKLCFCRGWCLSLQIVLFIPSGPGIRKSPPLIQTTDETATVDPCGTRYIISTSIISPFKAETLNDMRVTL